MDKMIKQSLFKTYSQEIYLFISAIFLAGVVSTAFQGTFHNFVYDTFNIGADQRGMLEFPREAPGLAAMFIIGVLIFMGERKLLGIAIFATGFGLFGMANLSHSYYGMILFMIIWSTGQHIHISLIEPVALDLSNSNNKGFVLGRINAIRSIGIIAGTLLIWGLMGHFHVKYSVMYQGGFAITIIAAILYFLIARKKETKEKIKVKLVIKKKYILFYFLSALFGIRKQLFLVFAPWLLIRMYNQQPSDLAKLLLASAVLGIFIKPYLGKLIDKFGERKVLFVDALLIILLSSIYSIVPAVLGPVTGLLFLYGAFILDELLFSLRTARTTYLYKILDHPADLTPTISMGISIEHVFSMTVPIAAGIIWKYYGYYWVFIMAASIAVISAVVSTYIPDFKKFKKINST